MAWDHDGLVASGMGEEEVQQTADALRQNMVAGGYSDNQIQSFFGMNDKPDIEPIAEHIAQKVKQQATETPNDSWGNTIKSAWDNSVFGKASRLRYEMSRQVAGKIGIDRPELGPEAKLSPDAGWAKEIAAGAGQAVFDLPAYAATATLGATGSMGVTEGARSLLTQAYKTGKIQNLGDMVDLAEATAHGMFTGGVTGKFMEFGGESGIKAATKAASALGKEALSGGVSAAAEILGSTAGMSAASSALEGRAPTLKEFVQNAFISGGFHGLAHMKEKYFNTYEETGLHPNDVSLAAENDPVLKQELVSQNPGAPKSLRPYVEPKIKSDFVMVDGKLMRPESAPAQAAMKLEPYTPARMTQELTDSFLPEEKAKAARAHDPEAFKQFDAMSARAKMNAQKVRENTQTISSLEKHESNVQELSDVRAKLKVAPTPELVAREQELSKTESKDLKRAELAQSLRSHNETLRAENANMRSPELKDRMHKAWLAGEKTVLANAKDKIQNKVITLPEEPLAQPLPWLNPDFHVPSEHVPEMTNDAKKVLIDDSGIEDMFGWGSQLSRDDVMATLLQGHEEVAKSFAPETGVEVEGAPNENGQPTESKHLFLAPKPKGFKAPTAEGAIKFWFDKLRKLDTVSKGIEAGRSPYYTALHSGQSGARAALSIGKEGEGHQAHTGVFNPKTGEKLSESLVSGLEKTGVTKENSNDFWNYVLAVHAKSENAKNTSISLEEASQKNHIETGITDEEANAVIDQHGTKFEEARKFYTSWNNAWLHAAAEGGVLNKEQVAKWISDRPDYASFRRLNEDETGKGFGVYKKELVKGRTGSELPILHPMYSAIEKAHNFQKQIEENIAVHQFMDDPELVKEHVQDTSGGSEAVDETSLDSDPLMSKASEAKDKAKSKPGYVPYLDNGNLKVAKFHDPQLAETLQFMNYDKGVTDVLKNFYNAAKGYSALRRNVAIINPVFWERHNIRSPLFAALKGASPKDLFLAIGKIPEAWKAESEHYNEAVRMGAIPPSGMGVHEAVKENPFITGDENGMQSRLRNARKSVLDMVHDIITVGQKGFSLRAYETELNKIREKTGREPTFEEKQTAGRTVADMNLNGLRQGAGMKGYSSIAAFSHYSLGGMYAGGRAIMENPRKVATAGALMMGASLYSWASLKGDPDYDDMSEFKKNSAIWFKVNGALVPVPVPWELGHVFATIPRLAAEHAFGGKEWGKKELSQLLSDFNPLKLPDLAQDALAIGANFNTWTGKNTVNDQLINLAPEAQVQPYTSNLGLAASKVLQTSILHLNSPLMVDKIVSNFIGTPGMTLLSAMETTLQSAGVKMPIEKSWDNLVHDNPLLRGFTESAPTYTAQPLQDWRDEYTRVKDLHTSYQILYKAEKFDEAEAFQEKHPEIDRFSEYSDVQKALHNQNVTIQGYMLDKTMTADDRKRATEQTYRESINMVKNYMDEIRKSRENKS